MIEIRVVSGVEGPSVYVNGLRVDGPKPWGGGSLLYSFDALDLPHGPCPYRAGGEHTPEPAAPDWPVDHAEGE